MATLMAGIRGTDGKFYQKAVDYDKRGRVAEWKAGDVVTTDGVRGKEGSTRTFTVAKVTRYFPIYRINGKRVAPKSFKLLADAIAELRRVEALESSGKLLADFQENVSPAPAASAPAMSAPETGTWAALWEAYQSHMRRLVLRDKMSQETADSYIRRILIFDSFLGAKSVVAVKDITKALVEDFKDTRRASIKKNGGSGNGYVMDTAALRIMFNWAVAEELVAKSPVKSEGSSGSDAKQGAQPFSAAELQAMQRDEVLNGDTLIFWLLYQTGLRRGDAIDLRWRDVNGYISCVPQKTRRSTGVKVRVPVLPELKAALDAERERNDRTTEPDDHVLVHPDTKRPFSKNAFYRRVIAFGERAGVATSNPHRFRDSFAQEAYLRGCGAEEVAAYLGDDVKTVLKHYSFFSDERADRADAKLTGGKGMLAPAI